MASPTTQRTGSRAIVLRWALAGLWVLIIAVSLLRGERPSSLAAFDEAVSSGRVHAVQVVGALPAGATGSATVEMRWQDGWVRRVSEVQQIVSDELAADTTAKATMDGTPIVLGDVATHVLSEHPGLAVTNRTDAAPGSGVDVTVLGRQVSGWIAVTTLATGLATLALLITGPTPWRATRWAWFWIISNPLGAIGCLVFLVLSGPTLLLPTPSHDARRLRGGWAFLLAAAAGSLWRP